MPQYAQAQSPSPRLCIPRSHALTFLLIPRLQHEAAGAVFAELFLLLFLEHAEGFAGKIGAVNLRRVEAQLFNTANSPQSFLGCLLSLGALEKLDYADETEKAPRSPSSKIPASSLIQC